MVFIFEICNIINLAYDLYNLLLFKQPKIQPPGIMPGPVVYLFLMAILGGWGWINFILEGHLMVYSINLIIGCFHEENFKI